jgi:hypothetical protein
VQDPSPEVRRTAAQALLTLEVPGFELKVVKLLHDYNGHQDGEKVKTSNSEAAIPHGPGSIRP